MSDLEWLRQSGLAAAIAQLAEAGTQIVGICGGYQMLGQRLCDPDRIESNITEMPGLGLLPIDTVFTATKETHQVRGTVQDDRHCPGARGHTVTGYEIHMGQTRGGQPWLQLGRRDQIATVQDGAVNRQGNVWGCYLHGLFANDDFCRHWLGASMKDAYPESTPGLPTDEMQSPAGYSQRLEGALERLADEVQAALDMSALDDIVWKSLAEKRLLL
jgi:adenosylcobyric acid synthase